MTIESNDTSLVNRPESMYAFLRDFRDEATGLLRGLDKPVTSLEHDFPPEQYHAAASTLMHPHHLHYKRSRSRGNFNCGLAFQHEPEEQNQSKKS
ncbi:hypothetical protein V6N13_148119 [Hibiscus sabdariffa]